MAGRFAHERAEIIGRGSALRSHSMDQENMKFAFEGERRLRNTNKHRSHTPDILYIGDSSRRPHIRITQNIFPVLETIDGSHLRITHAEATSLYNKMQPAEYPVKYLNRLGQKIELIPLTPVDEQQNCNVA